MERFKLNVPTLVPQKVHHHFKVGLGADVSCHNVVVCPIEKDLTEQLEGLSLCDVVCR